MEAPTWVPGGRGIASCWPRGDLQVGVGWPQGGRGMGSGDRGVVTAGTVVATGAAEWAPLAGAADAPGPETSARAKVTQLPALTHPRDRPRGPGRKVRSRAGPRGLSFPGAGPAGRGRGRRVAARLPVEGDGALLPFALPVGAVRSRAADHHLGPRAPRRRQTPALASPRRARSGTAPRGGARRHGCGTWEPAPAAPYGKMAAPASARRPPALGARGLRRPAGRCPLLAAPGVGGGARPSGSVRRHGAPGPSVRQDGRACGSGRMSGRRARPKASLPTCAYFRRPGGSLPKASARAPWAAGHFGSRGGRPVPGPAVRQDGGGRASARTSARTSGPARASDWPRRRPVASRCGPVGATRRSVGGRRGKMDAGEGLPGRWGPARPAPQPPGARPARPRPRAAGRADGGRARSGRDRWPRGGRRGSDSPALACLAAFPVRPQRPVAGPAGPGRPEREGAVRRPGRETGAPGAAGGSGRAGSRNRGCGKRPPPPARSRVEPPTFMKFC